MTRYSTDKRALKGFAVPRRFQCDDARNTTRQCNCRIESRPAFVIAIFTTHISVYYFFFLRLWICLFLEKEVLHSCVLKSERE